MRLAFLSVLVFAVGGGFLPEAKAQQYAQGARISRPSDQGPTQQIGGRYAYTIRGDISPLGATRRDVSLLGEDRFTFMQRKQRGRRAEPLQSAELGLYGELSPPQGRPLSYQFERTGDPTTLSGLDTAMSLDLGLPMYRDNLLPGLTAWQYTPRPPSTPFENYFGLTPAAPVDKAGPTIQSVAQTMDANRLQATRGVAVEAVGLFRQATKERRDPRNGLYPTCRDCAANLERAVRRLKLVRDQDPQDWLASLLLAHAALEQEQPSLAMVYLVEAVARNNELFRGDPSDINQYFGDYQAETKRSAVMEMQVQRYRRSGELRSSVPEAQLLQAYCAWRLGDIVGAREAAARAMDLLKSHPMPEDVDRATRMADFSMALLTAGTGSPP